MKMKFFTEYSKFKCVKKFLIVKLEKSSLKNYTPPFPPKNGKCHF